jgi:hypothetical protein
VPPTMTPTRMTAWLEQAWLIRYLDRQLAGEEADWFEAYALDKPELLAMIEVDTRLRDALAADATMRHTERSVADEGRQGGAAAQSAVDRLRGQALEASANEHPPPRPAVPAANESMRRHKPLRSLPLWLATAASLLIGVGLGAGWVATRAPSDAVPAVIASPTRIIYDTMRGTETLPRIEHADSTSPFALIEVAVPPGAENITLNMTGTPAQVLSAAPDGFVSFIVNKHAFAGSADTRVDYDLRGRRTQLPIRLRE